jgi:hypothetical protein
VRRCLNLLLQNAPDGDVKRVQIRLIWQPPICPVLKISFLDVVVESFAGGEQIICPGVHGTNCSLRTMHLVGVCGDPFTGGNEKVRSWCSLCVCVLELEPHHCRSRCCYGSLRLRQNDGTAADKILFISQALVPRTWRQQDRKTVFCPRFGASHRTKKNCSIPGTIVFFWQVFLVF